MNSIDDSSALGEDSDDDFDWEEVAVPDIVQQQPDDIAQDQPESAAVLDSHDIEPGPSRPHIEITIKAQNVKSSAK